MTNKKRNRLKTAAKASLLALALVLSFAACNSVAAEEPSSEVSVVDDLTVFPTGATLDGIDIAGMTPNEARDAAREAILDTYKDTKITLRVGDETIEVTSADFTVVDTLDISLSKALADRTGKAYKTSYSLKFAALEEKLETLAETFDTEGEDATVEGFDNDAGEFVFTASVDGQKLDVRETVKKVSAQMKKNASAVVEAVVEETPAALTEEDLKKKFTMLSSYETVSTNTANGNHNMGLALERVNGTVLQPGDVFSYEGIVGDSTNASTGFLPAGGLTGGALVQMYGGGICQASSTIYCAAMACGMEVVERWCHSSPSTYVPIGLDATVSYGDLDLKFRNVLESPVYVRSWMDGVTLHVEFYGMQPEEWDTIDVSSWETSSIAPYDTVRYVTDYNLSQGEVVLSTSGNWGYTASAQRDYIKDGEVVRSDSLPSSKYDASGVIYRVGPGTDTDNLSNGQPKATATPAPTATPAATATPAPAATATPAPATPAPVVTPEPTAVPTPEPVVTPEPTAAPTAAPTPVDPPAEPTADPGEPAA